MADIKADPATAVTVDGNQSPSFLLVQVDDLSRMTYLEHSVAAQLSWPGQSLFTVLRSTDKGADLVLARAAYKKLMMLQGGTPAGAIKALKIIPGVKNARVIDGALVSEALKSRDAPPPPAAPAAVTASQQWYLDTIRARAAWTLLGPSPDALAWKGVKVGHIDTGITQHPVFGDVATGQSWIRWDRGINYREPGSLPIDPLGYKGFPGHGTRTSSVLSGRSKADQFYGVAPGVTVIPYRITNTVVIDFAGNPTRIAQAMRHAVSDAGCHVVSVSLGDPCVPAEGFGAAVDDAYEAGVILVAAAGNVTSEVTYPGKFSRAITAGGSTRADTPWQGGSRGRKVDLSAPADEIFRADAVKSGTQPAYSYGGGGDGTSYATAMIAGAAALWRAFHADALDSLYREGWQTVEAFRSCARQSARRLPDWPTTEYGAGILNVEALLRQPLPPASSLVYEKRLAAEEIL
ncbi:S8/S53 family peptidase [Azospirillum sp. TSO22-1]|uniref:S8 family peptidase n=1 Tax=Azospirillum sp. TSO22-1 TaxID=716789 RepID=UPI000D61AFD3|nr:S8/S53 family peptidase [Azospirillum sp. TSO22-1]PWC54298.1 hypothetical protein TSO221_08605 [Azospirillum sp. TSO22-1]